MSGSFWEEVNKGRVSKVVLTVVGVVAFASVGSAGTLFFSQDSNSNGLYELNVYTGGATLVGASGVSSSTCGLAPGHLDAMLLGSQPFGILHTQQDGSGSALLPNSVTAEGLAYDSGSGLFYGAINGSFFTINPDTGL